MTEWTKESLDALIDGLLSQYPTPTQEDEDSLEADRDAMEELRDAILASQPERVETRTKPLLDVIDLDDEQEAYNHFRDVIHGAGDPSQPERVESQFKCGDTVEWFGHPAIIDAVTFRTGWDEPRYEIVVPSDENQRHYDILGQSLKGAGE